MADWTAWLEMARESEKVARTAEQAGHLRSSISRFYYAAYQAATAILLYRKQRPPIGREGWSHAETPTMLRQHLTPILRSEDRRKDLAAKLGWLYKARVDADYIATVQAKEENASQARKRAVYLVKIAEETLVGENRS